MKVFLTTAYKYNPGYNFATSYITESAAVDPFKVHHLVTDPKDADLIIFTEHHPSSDPYFFEIFKNNIYKTYKHKCYLYHDSDNTISLIPNVTPSLELSNFSEVFNQPFSYIIQMSP